MIFVVISSERNPISMRKAIPLIVALSLLVTSCATVLRKDLMQTGIRDFSFADLTAAPDVYKGRLFILGGVIAGTSVTENGSLVEALYVPVDSSGYLEDRKPSVRFLALYPKERGILDPMIYRKNRQITLAGIFTGTQRGKIDSMEYTFAVFQIEQIYLWEERPVVQYVPYPWGPYWGPPWPYRYYPYYW
ncbi:MAG: Outer membrane protein slp precursor [Syntrophorhabdaceae bacterium PtaU1.Bin034]|nr:MAG: Outer membrane protein slp precursor [Syntrophorhabdaceae bacterium PtaU1.Bin034]